MKSGLRICAAAGCGVLLGAAAPGDRCRDCFRAGRPSVTRARPIRPQAERPRGENAAMVVYHSRPAAVTQGITAAEALRRAADREAERRRES